MRITIKDLEMQVNRINELTNSPKDYYTLEAAYGGYKLASKHGSVDVTTGYRPKKDLYYEIVAFIKGLEVGLSK